MRMKFFSDSEADVRRKMQTIGLSGMVALSMTVYFFTGLLNSVVLFAMLLCMFTGCYVGSKAIISDGKGGVTLDYVRVFSFQRKNQIEWLWCLPLISLGIGYLQGSWRMGNLIDLIVIVCCLAVVLDAPRRSEIYSVSMKLMGGFALFYAVSIWIQMLLPDVYEIYLKALNNGSDVRINKLTNYYTGFTTSPGHTATYLAMGICIFAQDYFEKKKRTIMIETFLVLSLFFTGMRMPVLAVCIILVFFVLMVTPAEKRKKFIVILLSSGLIALLFIIFFRKPLSRIPVLRRTFASIEALFNGKDISSGRMDLYRHAFSLFLQRPILGIGWGNFKGTVVGVVTKSTPFEVHNIVLQLLCETGILGCVCFLIPMVYTLVKTIQFYDQLLKKNPNDRWTKLMGFSCAFQMFFLLFGMTDNILYYTFQEICYLISCSIPVSYMRRITDSEEGNGKNDSKGREI